MSAEANNGRRAVRKGAQKSAIPGIPKRLRELMFAVGIENANQLAGLLGISATGPSRWVSGEQVVTVENLEKILLLTGASADWLLLGRGEMFPVHDELDAFFNTVAVAVDRARVAAAEKRETERKR